MLRFKTIGHTYNQPRITIEADGARALEDCVVRGSSEGWKLPFRPKSDLVIAQISLMDPRSAATLAQWAAREEGSAAREGLITGTVNAANFAVTGGAMSGAASASWAALVRPGTWMSAGLRAGWQGALVGAVAGALTGVAQWWHLNTASDDDGYLAAVVTLRDMIQRGEQWTSITRLYDRLQTEYDNVGPAAQAAWVTTRAVIDSLVLAGLDARGANGAAA